MPEKRQRSLSHVRIFLILFLSVNLIYPLSMVEAAGLTPQKEKEIGDRFHLRIAATNAILDDPYVNAYYNSLTSRLMRGAGLKPGQYKFYIVKSNGMNAFAVPGGYIYMHTETINKLSNEGELASIVGHEIAHVAARHFSRRVEAASNTSVTAMAAMLAGVLIASQGGGSAASAFGPAVMTMGAGASIQSLLANSRDDEAEADAKGRQYLIKAGYDPKNMYGAFKVMSQGTYYVSSDMPTYLSTHPALSSRLATTFKDYAGSALSAPDPAYNAFRDRVLALAGDVGRVQKQMNSRLQKNSNDASALHALGLVAIRQQNFSVAQKRFSQALSLSPSNQEYLTDMGDLMLRMRKTKEAKAYFEKAGQSSRSAVLGLARACELLNEKSRAATLYDKAVNMDSSTPYPDALEMGGRFFGQNGQKAKGHYYMARYFASKGNLDQAIFHFEAVTRLPDAGSLKKISSNEAKRYKDIKKDMKKR